MFRAEAERLALSQADIASATGIEGSLISRLMSGKLVPSADKLRAIVRSLDPENGVGSRLALAAIRDLLEEVGLASIDFVVAQRSSQEDDEWWRDLAAARRDRYRAIEAAAVRNPEFDQLIDDLEPLALRMLAELHDSGRIVDFRAAEDPPSSS